MQPTKLLTTLTAVSIALASLAGCVSFGDEQERVAVPGPKPLTIEVPAGGTVALELANGDATVIAAPTNHVEISVAIRCPQDSTRCRERAAKASLNSKNSTNSARFELAGAPGSGSEVTTEVRVPEDRALDVRMKYGALRIDNHRADLNVRMTAGDIDITRPERGVGRVELKASVGDASLSSPKSEQEGRRPLLVGSTVEWDGTGDSTVTARLRFGDVDLSLTE
ncbi:MAG: DUF4097 family beta strand repeat-containing protein [Pseudomonadota bacterium]